MASQVEFRRRHVRNSWFFMYSVQVCVCVMYFCNMFYTSGSSSTLYGNITSQVDEFLHCHWKFWIPVTWKQCQKYENLAPSFSIWHIRHIICYLLSEDKFFFGEGLGSLQQHNVHTKFRRNWSARSEVETGSRGKESGSNKTDSPLNLEFLLQGMDVG